VGRRPPLDTDGLTLQGGAGEQEAGWNEVRWIACQPALFIGGGCSRRESHEEFQALQAGGIDIAAIHNHMVGETPHVIYLHFSGHSRPVASRL
jgi:hypothetical protein